MITIICGEDTAASRNFYNSLKKKYTADGFDISNIKATEIEKINLWLSESPSLFNQKKIFFSEGLNKLAGRNNKQFTSELEKISRLADTELFDWEDISAWELKIKKLGKVKEFKPDVSIFNLLDSIAPGNKMLFLSQLSNIMKTQSEMFIIIMILRSVRNLLIIKSGEIPAKMQSWQLSKLKSQAAKWKLENLVNFYDSLYKLDLAQKTGSGAFSIGQSLTILACHFL